MLKNDIIFARSKRGKLIALTRVLSDSIYHTVVADVIVHPKYRGKGIGKAMMDKVKRKYGKTGIYIDALASEEDFFEKLGYKKQGMTVLSARFKDN